MNIKKKKEREQCDKEVKFRNMLSTHKKKGNTGLACCEQWDSRIYLNGYLLILGLIEESPRNETQDWVLDWLGVKNVTPGFKVICCYKVWCYECDSRAEIWTR